MQKVLVTGGAGFVGSHLVDRLLALGHEVNIIDDLSSGMRSDIPREVNFFEADIGDRLQLRKAMDGCDTVFHLAARVELQKSIADPADCFSVNVTGTTKMVMEVLKRPETRLVFASSSAVYPLDSSTKLSEDCATFGQTPYAMSKRLGEEVIAFYAKLNDLNACSLRFFNIYGPGQRQDSPYAAVIPNFISGALHDANLNIYGTGEQTRDFIHVSDAVDAYILAANCSVTGNFNVGTGRATSILALAQLIQDLEGRGKIEFSEPRPGDAASSCADTTKIDKFLKFTPKILVEDGIRELYYHHKQQLAQSSVA